MCEEGSESKFGPKEGLNVLLFVLEVFHCKRLCFEKITDISVQCDSASYLYANLEQSVSTETTLDIYNNLSLLMYIDKI